MEGSGVADSSWSAGNHYLIVRGIADYCDPKKNDKWQEHAAICAAAYTRCLIERLPPPVKAIKANDLEKSQS